MRLHEHATGFWGLLKPSRRRVRRSHDPVIHRGACQGTRLRVANQGGIRYLFVTATSQPGHPMEEQVRDTLNAVNARVQDAASGGVVIQRTFFLAKPEAIGICRQVVAQSDGEATPITSYILQKPADGAVLAVEAWAVICERSETEIRRCNDHVTSVGRDGVTWIHCGQIAPSTDSTRVYEQSAECFQMMDALLDEVGVQFERVVRTWLYLGDIVGPEADTQRYKELNRARADFFAELDFPTGPLGMGPAFPASTGIGADGNDLVIGGIALASERADVRVVPLENPRQTAAFDYAEYYSPKSPKFSRAMAVAIGTDGMIFLSGTASITQSETRHLGDPAAQTHETLDNIAALISEDNLASHGLDGLGASLGDLAVARVYVKRPEDFETIRGICQARLHHTPVSYTIADVCRPELLVEIEGVAFSRTAQDVER